METATLPVTGRVPDTPTRRIAPCDIETVESFEKEGWKLHATVQGEYRFLECEQNTVHFPPPEAPEQGDSSDLIPDNDNEIS